MILLDTCVLSEAIKPAPDGRVLSWLAEADEEGLFVSVIALGELYRGIGLLEAGAKKDSLSLWFESLRERFSRRTVAIDVGVMLTWGDMSARLKKAGTPVPLMASLIAATAIRNNALLATRNTADYAATGAQTWNPWLYGD